MFKRSTFVASVSWRCHFLSFVIAVATRTGLAARRDAIETVHGYLRQAASEGVAVLLLSEDLDEVRALADRIVVIYEGELTGDFDPKTATVEEIGLAMAGGERT